nr:hypothetical protein [Desulfobacula sp.]
MKNTILRLLFNQARFSGLIVMLLIFNTGAASGADIQTPEGYTRSNTLPAAFLTLVPKGYTVESPQMVKYGPMGDVTFFAQKRLQAVIQCTPANITFLSISKRPQAK